MDAEYAFKATDRRSVSYRSFMYGSVCLCWFSRPYECVTLSTSGTKYVVVGDVAKGRIPELESGIGKSESIGQLNVQRILGLYPFCFFFFFFHAFFFYESQALHKQLCSGICYFLVTLLVLHMLIFGVFASNYVFFGGINGWIFEAVILYSSVMHY